MEGIFRALRADMGGRVVSVLRFDRAAGQVHLVWSSDPAVLPFPALMPMPNNRWSLQVMIEGDAFMANAPWEFDGLVPFVSMAAGAVLNLPLGVDGDIAGAVTVEGDEGHFDEVRVFALQSLLDVHRDGMLTALG
jgi:hypothetical protein